MPFMMTNRTTIAAMAKPAPLMNLVASTTSSTVPDMKAPMVLITRLRIIRWRALGSRSVRRWRFQCHHAGLAQREGDEYTHDVELYQTGDLRVVDVDQQ